MAITPPPPRRLPSGRPIIAPLPASLQKAGITRLEHRARPARAKLSWNIFGLEKEGKTRTALTGPGPVMVIDLDDGLGIHDQGLLAPGRVLVVSVKHPTMAGGKQACAVEITRAAEAINAAIATPAVRSLVVDAHIDLYNLHKLALLGTLTPKPVARIGAVNHEHRGLLRSAISSHLNTVFINRMRDEWVNDEPTGRLVPQQWKELPFLVDVNAQAWRDPEAVANEAPIAEQFRLTIMSCRPRPDLVGETFSGAMCSIPMLSAMILADTAGDSDFEDGDPL